MGLTIQKMIKQATAIGHWYGGGSLSCDNLFEYCDYAIFSKGRYASF